MEEVKRVLHDFKEAQIFDYIPPFRGRGVRIREMGREDTAIDYSLILAKKKREEKKLEKMMEYALSFSCRRNYILSYFGVTSLQENCQRCDHCVPKDTKANEVLLTDDQFVIIRKILSCLARMKKEYSMEIILKVLRGSRSQQIKLFGFDRLSTYGILKKFNKTTLKEIIEKLISKGCIEKKEKSMIIKGYMRRFYVLKLTEFGWKVMQAKVRDLRIDFPKNILGEKEKKEDEKYDQDLFTGLQVLRNGIAEDEGLPPFMILSNKVLKRMSRICPSNKDEFVAIKGLGEKTYKKYGVRFIEWIRNYLEENEINLKEPY
jgi:ATP-dependent DNA helicase RecQ